MAKGRNTSISAFGKKILGKEEVTNAAAAVCSFNQLIDQDRNLDTRTKMTLKTGENMVRSVIRLSVGLQGMSAMSRMSGDVIRAEKKFHWLRK